MSTATRDEADRVAGRRTVGFRPSSRSRIRILAGTLLSLFAIGVILVIFTANKRALVLQLVRDIPAGQVFERRRRPNGRTVGRPQPGGRAGW